MLQELLNKNLNEITDEEIKNASYGIKFAQVEPQYQEKQWALQRRLKEIEAARKPKGKLQNPWEAYRDDSEDDEYEWS